MKETLQLLNTLGIISLFTFVFVFQTNVQEVTIIRHEDQFVDVCCIIRNEGNGWFFINDTSHLPINVESIETTNELVIIYYNFTATKICTFLVTPDETFATEGYFCGASVWWNCAKIRISKIENGSVIRCNPFNVVSSAGNFWIYGKFIEGA